MARTVGPATAAPKVLSQRGQQSVRGGVVAEGLAHVGIAVHVAGTEDETAAELKGILAQTVLAMTAGLSALSRVSIVLAQQMEQGGLMQLRDAVGFASFVNQEREGDSGVFAEMAGVAEIAQTDDHKLGALLGESLFVLAQLRDVFSAEDSAVMTQEHNYGRSACPKRPEMDRPAVGIGQSQSGQLAAERFWHAGHFQGRPLSMSSWAGYAC
jgi:hypothetical protein